MADLKMTPATPKTHNEITFDLFDFTPNAEVPITIWGPTSTQWLGTLKTDGTGRAQLIWRTGQSGDHTLIAGTGKSGEILAFTVASQEGELSEAHDTAGAQTVEPVEAIEPAPAPKKESPPKTIRQRRATTRKTT